MADEMCFKMEQEDWQQEDNDPCYDPLDTATDPLKEEIKSEPGSPHKTVNDIQFESEVKNERQHVMQETFASASKTLECAAKLNTLSTKNMKSLCRPCRLVQERLDSRTKASAAAVFSCPLCNIGFTSKFRRDRHQRLSCRRRFSQALKTTLAYEDPLAKKIPAAFELGAKLNEQEREPRKHLKRVIECPRPDSRKRFMCADCIFSTDHLGIFNRHLVTHTGERRFACTMCEYKATQKVSLNRHLLTHGNVKPFACAECNYRTVHKFSLTEHMRSHTGEKPFQCTQCDYASNRRGTLTKHVRCRHLLLKQTKELRFACTQCEYKCVQSGCLTRHMLKHGAGKKLSCFECSYKCNYLCSLKNHMASKHGAEKKLSCLNCEYKCNNSWILKRHVATKHKDL